MAEYDNNNKNTLTLTSEKSEGGCPSCGTKVVIDGMWICPACGLNGNICNSSWLKRYAHLSSERRAELFLRTTHCLNGVIRIGDYVLPVDDSIPCLPGQVTAIGLADTGSCGSTGRQGNVHVDFSIFMDAFSEKRKREAAKFHIKPDRLIKITDVAPETMKEIMKSEANAIRHALRVVRNMVPWPWWQNDSPD